MPRAKTLLVSFLLTYCTLVWAKDIELQEAWISEAPPTVSVLAGYLRIINNMDKAVELSGVSSPIFESIEIHKWRGQHAETDFIIDTGYVICRVETGWPAPHAVRTGPAT